jgi:hypothetical protein
MSQVHQTQLTQLSANLQLVVLQLEKMNSQQSQLSKAFHVF